MRVGPALALVTATVTEVTPRTACLFDHGKPDGTASRYALRDLEFVERISPGDEQTTGTHDVSVQACVFAIYALSKIPLKEPAASGRNSTDNKQGPVVECLPYRR